MSITLESVNRINSLKQGIEATTGESYTDLTQAIQGLKDGYGTGGGSVTPEKPYMDSRLLKSLVGFNEDDKHIALVPYMDTLNVENFEKCFYCSLIKTLPDWNFSKGNRFYSTFESSEITGEVNLNIPEAVYNNYIFRDCYYLTKVNITAPKCVSFAAAFSGCEALTEVNLNGSGAVATSFNQAFMDCIELKKITGVDFSKCTNNTSTFDCCEALETIELAPGAKVNVNNNAWSLADCESLSIDSINNFILAMVNTKVGTTRKVTLPAGTLAQVSDAAKAHASAQTITLAE
jgi:hypothetical protein